jgi:O-antigen ligase
MAYYLTLIYITVSFLTPGLILGPLADLRPEVVLVLLAMAFSIKNIGVSEVLKSPQALAIAGMSFAVFASVIFIAGLGGFSSAVASIYGFLQPALLFFLIAVNCKTKRHLQRVILALVCGSLVFTYLGFLDLHSNVIPSPYIYGNGELRRLRGLGLVNDPNDFSQVMVSLIPCLFLWKGKSWFPYILLIAAPLGGLIFAMYLTHSRSASLALVMILFLSCRKKLGVLPSVIVASLLLAGTFAVGWSGGRDISMGAGEDRLELWALGLQLIKVHPLFGIGVDRFGEYGGLTAHNSVVVCAAETGLFGFYFWVLFIFSTIRSGVLLSGKSIITARSTPSNIYPWNVLPAPGTSENDVTVPEGLTGYTGFSSAKLNSSVEVDTGPRPDGRFEVESTLLPDEEISAMARILIYAIGGMLTAGWFLSRAYSPWLFMYCGMVYAVTRMARGGSLNSKLDPLSFLFRWSAITAISLLALVYAILRFKGLGG